MNARSRRLVPAIALILLAASPALGQMAVIRQLTPSRATVTITERLSDSVAVQAAQAAAAQSSSSSTSTASTAAELPPRIFAGPDVPRIAGAPRDSAQVQAEHQQNLQKIHQITFDRRPSSILSAWANPSGAMEGDKKKSTSSDSTKLTAETPKQPYIFPNPLDAELKDFQRFVTLGDWPSVKRYLAILPEDEAKPLYMRLLTTLPSNIPAAMNPNMPVQPNVMQFAEKSEFSHADILALASASPVPLEDDQIKALGRILQVSIQRGHAVSDFVERARAEIARPDTALTRRQAANLLASAGSFIEASAFLPDLETAEKDHDREALNLLSRHYLALNARDPKPELLERAWFALQSALSTGEADDEETQTALKAAVELAPRVRDELGESWLSESFADRPERGREILAAIGSSTSGGFTTQPFNPDTRSKLLELQKTAVEALLKAAPERAEAWRRELELLAVAWLAEAEFSHQYDTSTSLGPQLQRDVYGNYFYYDQMMMQNQLAQRQNLPRPIKVAEILDTRPDSLWLESVSPSFRPRFAETLSKLYLKVAEEDQAFPFIEQLAPTHPDQARDLAEQFLRIWTKNHDPNADRNRTNYYMYMFGFERRAESIPLTRSKQERNLKELSAWVKRLNKLPIDPVDESLLTQAFTTCHSSAEVYRLDAIEEVFGAIDTLKPETLASLIQQMRGNLAGAWRQPAVQQQAKTKRREKDIKAEVLRGYEVARSVIDRALEKHPGAWSLVLARAAIHLDENNYRQELDPSSDFTRERREALEEFARSARLYAAELPNLEEKDHSIEPFTMWFYASLGASDLAAVKAEMVSDPKQPALIRDTIASLPGETSKEHLDQFANALFTRMSAASPAVKFSYLKAGFEIIGDHEQAHEARKVFDYYKDLVTEIKLDAHLDGPASVGVDEPFGVLVQIRHTREIERESGGFGRYLQNQNNGGNMFFYNYGRPLENYRDKFQKAATDALIENFEVVSVTFEDEKVTSRATSEYGWRVTPYAYLLLKARSPKVDKLPPLRLDLDFLDTTGYAVLPVETPTLPIDAGAEPSSPRPYRNLNIVQTLDERQAGEGKLILEVKATAQGLVPDLDDILKPSSPGFTIQKTDDQGLSVARFDPDSDDVAISSERLWLVTFQGESNLESLPKTFHFAEVLDPDAETTYQRYVDADLAESEPVVSLERTYGTARNLWIWWTLGTLVLASALTVLIVALRRHKPTAETSRFRLPETITPFTVLGLLKDIEQNNGLSPVKKQELTASIQSLERHFFAEPSAQEPDLRDIAERWVRGAGR